MSPQQEPPLVEAGLPQRLSPQAQLAKRIFEYWTALLQREGQFQTITDQGAKWGAPEESPARTATSLYVGGEGKGRGTWMTRADVAVIDEHRFLVPYLVEIEAQKYIKPKIPTGLIGTTNMCRSFYRRKDYKTEYELWGAVLFVVLCSESYGDPNSKKRKQLAQVRRHFQHGSGCLRAWYICEGATVDEAFDAFKTCFATVRK